MKTRTVLMMVGTLLAVAVQARHPQFTRLAMPRETVGPTGGYRLFLLSGGWEQLMPRAVKPLFESYDSCNQDVHLPGLNSLESPNV